MADRVTRGPLVGRPYGGVSILTNNELCTVIECVVIIHCESKKQDT